MFRRVEDMDGGASEPRSFGEWRKHHGANFVAVLIAIGAIIAIAYVAGGLMQALD